MGTVTQYHFIQWPDHGVPVTTSHLMKMHKAAMETQKASKTDSPIVVHCRYITDSSSLCLAKFLPNLT